MKIGQKALLKLRNLPEQEYIIKYIGPYSVKLLDDKDSIHVAKKSTVRFQIYGPRNEAKRSNSSVYSISLPMGGQPEFKKR